MALFKRRSATKAVSSKPAEHAVIAHYTFAGELGAIHALEDELTAKIIVAHAGEYDGNEIGGGEAVLYAYGPDANALFAVMEPALRAFGARPAHAILRYGAATDPTAATRRVDL